MNAAELLDRWRMLNCNSHMCFAVSPAQPCTDEHWIVTEKLAPLRKAFNALSDTDQDQIRRNIVDVTPVVGAVVAAVGSVEPQPSRAQLTPAQMIKAYLELRTKVRELTAAYKERTGKLMTVMGTLEANLMKELDVRKEINIKCEHGTAFTQVETSATVEEWSITLDYIKRNEAWDLLERRVAKGAVLAAIAETKKPIPGVKVNQLRVLRVRTA